MVDRKRYDIAASEDIPLDYATSRRDSDVLSYLRTAFEEKTALLAYQPIVASRGSQGAVFYEGLIRIPDPTAAALFPHVILFFWPRKPSLADKLIVPLFIWV